MVDSIIRQQLVARRTHPDDVPTGAAPGYTVYLDGWSEDRFGGLTDRVTSQVYAGPFPTHSKASVVMLNARLSGAQVESVAADRVDIVWSDPLPDPDGTAMRRDPGGWCYRVFKDGRCAVSGTDHGDHARVEARARKIAADKGLTRDYPLRFLSLPQEKA